MPLLLGKCVLNVSPRSNFPQNLRAILSWIGSASITGNTVVLFVPAHNLRKHSETVDVIWRTVRMVQRIVEAIYSEEIMKWRRRRQKILGF